MSRADAKTIRIRCGTWDQVEAFYNEKVLANRGNILVVKMPFRPGIGEPITVALGLPDGLVFAIDGMVVKIGAEDPGRVPVAVRLHGLSVEVRAQLKRLVAQGRGTASSGSTPVGGSRAMGTRPPAARGLPMRALIETVPPPTDPSLRDVVEEERPIFDGLVQTRERLVSLPAHEVLGIPEDAAGDRLRAAYMALAMQVHPDRFRRYRSSALRVLAGDIFVLVRRAYDRLGATEASGPHGGADDGWLFAMPDPSEAPPAAVAAELSAPVEPMPVGSSSPYSEMSITKGAASSGSYEDEVQFTTSVRMRALTAEDLFSTEEEIIQAAPDPTPAPTPVPAATPPPGTPAAAQVSTASLEATGRTALQDGRFREACEAFAAYLRQDSRNRHVRALYHVANGLDLRGRGEGVKARLQFETALAHDKDCEEAQRALLPDPERQKTGIFKRLFDKDRS